MKQALMIGLMLVSIGSTSFAQSKGVANSANSKRSAVASSRKDDTNLKSMKQTACHMRASLTLDGCTDPSCLKGTGAQKNKAGGTDGSKKGG